MNNGHTVTIASAWLVLLASGAHGASSGSAAAAQAIPAPATPAAPATGVGPTAGVAAAGPVDSAGRLRAAHQSLARLQESLAPARRAVPGVLVIPARELAPETYDRIVEDFSIMSRIIEKGLQEGSAVRRMSLRWSSGRWTTAGPTATHARWRPAWARCIRPAAGRMRLTREAAGPPAGHPCPRP